MIAFVSVAVVVGLGLDWVDWLSSWCRYCSERVLGVLGDTVAIYVAMGVILALPTKFQQVYATLNSHKPVNPIALDLDRTKVLSLIHITFLECF